jgi:CubicO group peptidase (beta-lactamase class C family)
VVLGGDAPAALMRARLLQQRRAPRVACVCGDGARQLRAAGAGAASGSGGMPVEQSKSHNGYVQVVPANGAWNVRSAPPDLMRYGRRSAQACDMPCSA